MPDSGSRIVEVARSQIGNTDQTRYAAGTGESWCSDFVSWVYMQAERPFSGGTGVGDWHLRNVKQIMNWFQAHSTFLLKGFTDWDKFTPAPGDYICFGNHDEPISHSGIVEYLDDDDTIYTIEGDDAVVDRRAYPHFRTNMNFRKWVQGVGLRYGKHISIQNGTAMASSSGEGLEPRHAFDGSDETCWKSRMENKTSQYLQMEWPEKKTITKISLKFGDPYPADYQFHFNIGRPIAGPWMPSTVVTGNAKSEREHVWFRPVHHVCGVRLECLRYARDDCFSVTDMKILR